jgi:multidrug efflux system membrane fusion protein
MTIGGGSVAASLISLWTVLMDSFSFGPIITPLVRQLTLTSILAAAVCTGACSGEAASRLQPQSERGSDAVPVTIATVVQKAMPLHINVVGTAEASSSVAVHAQITGALNSVGFKEGDDVTKGQVLFTLDRRPLEATLDQVKANLARDMAQASDAQTQASRYQTLAQRGLVSGQELQARMTTAAALEATLGADRAAVENATVQLEYATVTAPISGRTGALIVHEGNLVRANDAMPLVVINQVAPINVGFGIPEAQMSAFKRYLAQRALRVEASPPNDTEPPSSGEIAFVDNAVDQTTGTIKVKGSFPNGDRRLWPGQFVNVVVTLTTDSAAIVVPTVAVQTGPQGQFVYVVKPNQSVDLRPVTVARASGAETIIKDGLTSGEIVVTDGQLRLVPGSRISVKTDAAPIATDDGRKGTR